MKKTKPKFKKFCLAFVEVEYADLNKKTSSLASKLKEIDKKIS